MIDLNTLAGMEQLAALARDRGRVEELRADAMLQGKDTVLRLEAVLRQLGALRPTTGRPALARRAVARCRDMPPGRLIERQGGNA